MRMSKAQARELGQALLDASDSDYDQMQIVYIDYTHVVAIPTLNGEHCTGGGIVVEYTVGVDDIDKPPPNEADVIQLFA
jgi:hypothetical protein